MSAAISSSADAVRDRLVQIVRDVERLSHSGLPPNDFFQQFLALLLRATGAQAGAVWGLGPQGLTRWSDANLGDTELGEASPSAQEHHTLLAGVLSNGQARILTPSSSFPRRHLVLLAPIQEGTTPAGLVELFLRADVPPQARAGYLQVVEQLCGFASRYLGRRNAPGAGAAADPGQIGFAEFVLRLQRTRSLAAMAAAAVNDGRLYFECDRVSLAVRRGQKVRIEAVSGQQSVHRNSNLVRAMRELACRGLASSDVIRYCGRFEDLPPPLEKPLAEFVHEGGAKMVLLVPLFELPPEAGRDGEDDAAVARPRRAVGCLILEQLTESHLNPDLARRVDQAAEHVAAVLDQTLRRERVPFRATLEAVGAVREWFRGRLFWRTMAILAVLTATGTALTWVEWPYRVSGEGRLMPVVQREVFAPDDGQVVEVLVSDGVRVAAGQPLVRMESAELQTELVRLKSELAQKVELASALRSLIDGAVRAAERSEEVRLQGERAETLAEVEGLEAQLAALEHRMDRLLVRAPIEGVVTTFQVDQLLAGRPVQRGEVLLEVMDDRGPWRLEFEVEGHRLGHLIRGGEFHGTERLPVEYVLATIPEETYTANLDTIATRAVSSEERGNVIEVMAELSEQRPRHLRIGAEVRAKIDCGDRSLGYVLFGDVIEFARKWLWI